MQLLLLFQFGSVVNFQLDSLSLFFLSLLLLTCALCFIPPLHVTSFSVIGAARKDQSHEPFHGKAKGDLCALRVTSQHFQVLNLVGN